jgi:hypothetical protein
MSPGAESTGAESPGAGERRLTCILVSRRLTGADVVRVGVPRDAGGADPATVSVAQWQPTSVGVFATPSNPAPVRWVPLEPRWQEGELVVELPALAALWIEMGWSG